MDLGKMSSREIVSYVRRQTGKRITIPLKSKKSIIKKAKEILGIYKIPDKAVSRDNSSLKTKEIQAILDQINSLVIKLAGLL